jgi:hypothetical protein
MRKDCLFFSPARLKRDFSCSGRIDFAAAIPQLRSDRIDHAFSVHIKKLRRFPFLLRPAAGAPEKLQQQHNEHPEKRNAGRAIHRYGTPSVWRPTVRRRCLSYSLAQESGPVFLSLAGFL